MARKRYYVCNHDGIPLSGQPDNGYTLNQACARVSREETTDKRLGIFTDRFYRICDTKFTEWVL